MNLSLIYYILSLLSAVSISGQQSQLATGIESPQCKVWVDSVYNSLDETGRIGQLMFVNVSPTHGDQSKATIKTMVEKYKVGGIFLSEGDARQFAEMNNYAQSLARVPLMMAIDGEWGPRMRVADAPEFPYNMALGAIQNPALLMAYGYETARECKALGIDVDFAPVLDVNSNPKNPVIGYRSLGESPERVALLGKAYSVGMEEGGVIAVAKHFPGHGDTDSDSHKTLPTVNHPLAVLDSVDLVPFKEFFDAGCNGVMVGHLAVPAVDASKRPTSMSRKAVTDLLKTKMHFKGLIFTDGLGMKGANVNENVCVAALKAGNDILVGPPSVGKDIEAVRAALANGTIPAKEFEQSVKKLLAYKYILGLNKRPAEIDACKIVSVLNSPEAEAVAQNLADASMTLLRNKDDILPIGNLDKNTVAVVNIGAPADNTFSQYCGKYTKVDTYTTPLTASTLTAIRKHDIVIAAVYNDKPESCAAYTQLKGIKGLVSTFFINPYKLKKFQPTLDTTKALLMAYDKVNSSQRAAAMALFGGIRVDGKLPVNVNGIAAMNDGIVLEKTRLGYSSPAAKGMKVSLPAEMDSVVAAGIKAGAFPGAQVIVIKDGDIIIDRCYGKTTAGGDPVTPNTLYDLASVSKAVGTLPGVMKAYDLGLFELDTPVSKYIAGLNRPDKKDITPKMLLHHESGMRPALNMFVTMMDSATYKGKVITGTKDKDHTIFITGGGWGHKDARLRTDVLSTVKSEDFPIEIVKGIYGGKSTYDTVMQAIYRTPVDPKRKFAYSCLNFCLLMDLEQNVTGKPHYEWVTDSVWAPIGANTFCYRPTEKYPLSRIAATEKDTYLRKQHVHGYVHDELACFSGGVQGNAGVFGTATDIAKLSQMWLNGGWYGDKRIYSTETNTLFTTDKSPTCRRGLGFDKPDTKNPDNSPVIDEVSAATYGHTGFTGTCFWIDPKENLVYIFLSNRVDPTRDNKAWSKTAVRSALHRMVYEALTTYQYVHF